jgi:hypothetical protein
MMGLFDIIDMNVMPDPLPDLTPAPSLLLWRLMPLKGIENTNYILIIGIRGVWNGEDFNTVCFNNNVILRAREKSPRDTYTTAFIERTLYNERTYAGILMLEDYFKNKASILKDSEL